eukprot:6210445-Pleurochrysis_carterae.AAC.2
MRPRQPTVACAPPPPTHASTFPTAPCPAHEPPLKAAAWPHRGPLRPAQACARAKNRVRVSLASLAKCLERRQSFSQRRSARESDSTNGSICANVSVSVRETDRWNEDGSIAWTG